MVNVRLEHVLTIAKLLLKGAGKDFVEVTSTSVGTEISKSQQATSKIILELENQNFIERIKMGHGFRIHVTEKGIQMVKDVSSLLISAINFSNPTIIIEGVIVSGIGEGGYYMSLPGYKKQFESRLGYIPYAGTLNVKVSDNPSLRNRKKIERIPYILIKGYNDSKRTYGWVKCFPVSINDAPNIDAHLLILERSHYDESLVEIISSVPLKDSLRLRNGDKIKIEASAANSIS
jgi:riboflavin kinase, archaea type